jgi:hypothetical protein
MEGVMPRHYFHISKDAETFKDTDGFECQDLVAAHRYAMQLIFKTMLYDPEERDWRGWRIDVADKEGLPRAHCALSVCCLDPPPDIRPKNPVSAVEAAMRRSVGDVFDGGDGG